MNSYDAIVSNSCPKMRFSRARGSSAEALLRGRLAEAHVFSHAKNAIENGCFFLYVGPGREVRNR